MGGRGSSSSGSGGGGGGAAMPTLSGSAKQVAWAETIRSDALANANAILKNASDEFGLDGVSVKAAKVVKAEVTDTLKSITSASTIINNRSSLTYNSILNLAKLETRTGQVSAARKARKS